MLGIVIATTLSFSLAFNIPAVQRWIAHGIAQLLQSELGTRVEVGRIYLGVNGRIIIDHLAVEDQQRKPMLQVARLGAQLNAWDLFQGRIRIGNTQLFGLHAQLYQTEKDEPTNFQFVLDAFASQDTTSSSPIDLRIGQIVIRRGNVKWDQYWKPQTQARFNPAHLALQNLNFTGQLKALTSDSLHLEVKRLDVREQSGLCIKNLHFDLEGNRSHSILSNFELSLPHSTLHIPQLTAHYRWDDRQMLHAMLSLHASLSSTDFTSIHPIFNRINNTISIDLEGNGTPMLFKLHKLQLTDQNHDVRASINGSIFNLSTNIEQIATELSIDYITTTPQFITKYAPNPYLESLGEITLSGGLRWRNPRIEGDWNILTRLGQVQFHGEGDKSGQVQAHITSPHFALGQLGDGNVLADLGNTTLDLTASGQIPNDFRLQGLLPLLEYKGYPYRNIELNTRITQEQLYEGSISIQDPNLALTLEGKADFKHKAIRTHAQIQRIAPHALNLTTRYLHTHFSGTLWADLQGQTWENMAGQVQLNDFTMATGDSTYRPGDIHFTSKPNEGERHLMLISPFLEAQLNGQFAFRSLASNLKQMASTYLPSLITATEKATNNTDYGSAVVRLYNAEPLRRLTGIDLHIEQPITLQGAVDAGTRTLELTAQAPRLRYGNEHLQNIDLRMESNRQSLRSSLKLQRLMKGNYVDFGIESNTINEQLNTRLYWNNQAQPLWAGDINLVSRFWKDQDDKLAVSGEILPSNLVVNDSLWNIYPGSLAYHDGVLEIDSFAVGRGAHYLRVDGKASKNRSDTLHAELRNMKLEYIFSLINFHAVDFTGEVTGHVYGHSLFSQPYADAFLQIPQFAINQGTLGNLKLYGNWGRRKYSIFLDGVINDPSNHSLTLVQGDITPKKDVPHHGLNLDIKATRANLFFLNKFTSSIFDNLQGRASGWARLYGPFKELNVEGDLLVNEASIGIPFTGVRYHLENDSISLRPDNIYFTNATLYDPQGSPQTNGHRGKVSGHLRHKSLSDLQYDIQIEGNNLLAYDFKEFGDMPFYGTVYATGNVRLTGSPGQVDIGIKAQPERGTTLTYNATSPDKLTQSQFITYIDRKQKTNEEAQPLSTPAEAPESDIRINFDLDVTPQSTLNLLMDARAGDMLSLNGQGRMLARYYNKGSFQLFGTYRVEHGTYGLSVQEIIRKNFEFKGGGTMVFTGDPFEADLNLQAAHMVSGVSLNDISARATFSNTSARVNCLMNITGKARHPRISFDFDILNVNEDEKQMVRSLISTEEERNMQVVYLLGIGRFYTYDYNNATQGQGYTAMNSLLSSTLSGQINQMLANMTGNTNWNFGANLSTGETGWSDMDVEGMLQGSLLNNRLLLNGNFGYRDNPMAATSFVGDFDAQYLLTRTGTVSLKAYSQTNDRYFTKSSLTTQGIGLRLKKDFSSWRNLFRKK